MTLPIGAAVPDLTARNQHGEQISLAQYRGSKSVVVMFYPYAFSGICTSELAAVRDRLPDLSNDHVEILAISCDPVFALRTFADEQNLSFSLLSDFWPHGQIASRYGVFDHERGCALRGTFVVDSEGVLRWKVEHALPDGRDLDDCIAALRNLRE